MFNLDLLALHLLLLDHLTRTKEVRELSRCLAILRNLIMGEAQSAIEMKKCGGQWYLEQWLKGEGEEECPMQLKTCIADLLKLTPM